MASVAPTTSLGSAGPMSGTTLPNGCDRTTWLSEIETRIAELTAELDTTEDRSNRLSISNEIREREHQLQLRRAYLRENSP